MKILSRQPISGFIVEVDSGDFPTYFRCSADSWENLMGMSWEPVHYPEQIEKAYQDFIKEGG